MTQQQYNAIGMVQLSHIDFTNANAGEGGSQHANIKEYAGYPYISGQSVRHSIKDVLQDIDEEQTNCTPEAPCGDIETCVFCDLFGYMDTDMETQQNRYSPVHVSAFLAIYLNEITVDNIVQFDKNNRQNSMPSRELSDNVYKSGVMVNTQRIGVREKHQFNENVDDLTDRYNRELVDKIGQQERNKRVRNLLEGIKRMNNFADQARNLADFTPDLVFGVVQEDFDQRIHSLLETTDEGDLNLELLRRILKEYEYRDVPLYYAGNKKSKVINNWDAVEDVVKQSDAVTYTPSIEHFFGELKQHYE